MDPQTPGNLDEELGEFLIWKHPDKPSVFDSGYRAYPDFFVARECLPISPDEATATACKSPHLELDGLRTVIWRLHEPA